MGMDRITIVFPRDLLERVREKYALLLQESSGSKLTMVVPGMVSDGELHRFAMQHFEDTLDYLLKMKHPIKLTSVLKSHFSKRGFAKSTKMHEDAFLVAWEEHLKSIPKQDKEKFLDELLESMRARPKPAEVAAAAGN
jgi:hypothetical protein